MKKAEILLLLMSFACCAYAQQRHVRYSYDTSGNRVSRTIVIDSNRSKQKSTNIDKDACRQSYLFGWYGCNSRP